ncbi:hypothetical protein RSAG8_07908, partial [Rhizoctonia solani AG-8 WAC10335]
MFNIPVMSVDHYDALGLKRENEPGIEEIQNAYRHLALHWHPERNKGTMKRETAALKFIEINEAYKVLMDQKLREAKAAEKGKKSKKDGRAMSPSTDPASPNGRSKSRPRWSAAALMSRSQLNATPDLTVSSTDVPKDDGDRHSPNESNETPRSSMAPSHTSGPARSTFASPPPPSLFSSQLGPQFSGPYHSYTPEPPRSSAPSRGTSPSFHARAGPEIPITAPTPTRTYPENSRASYNTVRSPPAVYTPDQDVRLPRYLRPMSDGASEIGSESSYFNGHSVSVAGSVTMDDFGMFNIPVMSVDHYDALGLKRENEPGIEEIQNAYRHLALHWHPERNKGTMKRETAALKFIEINEAYKVLMDQKLREAKAAGKGKKSKKDGRAMSPSTDPASPNGRSKRRAL